MAFCFFRPQFSFFRIFSLCRKDEISIKTEQFYGTLETAVVKNTHLLLFICTSFIFQVCHALNEATSPPPPPPPGHAMRNSSPGGRASPAPAPPPSGFHALYRQASATQFHPQQALYYHHVRGGAGYNWVSVTELLMYCDGERELFWAVPGCFLT